MTSIIAWCRRHLVSLLLLFVIVGLLVKDNLRPVTLMERSLSAPNYGVSDSIGMAAPQSVSTKSIMPPVPAEAPPTDTANRLVIHTTSLSLQVKSVPSSLEAIQKLAEQNGGYLVSSNLSVPQESASATITIRVPETARQQTINAIKQLGLKTVSESVTGQDVTDQYIDIDAHLQTLNQTKTKFEDILNQATKVQDILDVQRQIISLQSQIDSLKGQQQYLEQSAKLAKITIYLSTDEFSLPYAPAESWRPEVIFKTAVRSLVKNARNLGTALIWIAVYAPVWLTILIIYWFYRRRQLRSNQ